MALMGALSKLQLSLFCFIGSLCLQVVTLNLEEALLFFTEVLTAFAPI